LRADAVLSGESRILVTDTSRLERFSDLQKKTIRRFNLPEGWVTGGEAVIISHTGTCFGGDIIISDKENRRASYKLIAPKCTPIRYKVLYMTPVGKGVQPGSESP